MKTSEKYAGQRAGNYCTLPTRDVEILPDTRFCDTCGVQADYQPGPGGGMGSWVHVGSASEHGYISPKTRCTYCHNQESDVVYRQHAWYDAVECGRCGGVDGRAIGD